MSMKRQLANGERDEHSKEAVALRSFKEKIADLMKEEYDDLWLEKWLIARNYDVEKAEKMFRESRAYREKMKIDTILEDYEPPEVIRLYLAGGMCGHDKDGAPVCIEPFGSLDIKGLMCSAKKSDLERSKMYLQEQVLQECRLQSQKLGKPIDKITVIMDMDNMGTEWLWRPGMQMHTHLIELLENNYPEFVKRILIIRAPRIFPVLYKLTRPLLSEDMRQKISVLGSDYREGLSKYIDADELPAYLGGNMTDPDGNGRCPSRVCPGGKVPKEMYMSDIVASADMTAVTVPRGEKYKVEFSIDKPGILVRWEIKTEDYDIAFSMHRKKGKKSEEVIPFTRLQSHLLLEDGSIICEEAGTYVICFDNTYSWTKNKKLYYLLELHTTDEENDCEIDAFTHGGSWTRLVKDMQITHL